MDKGNIYRYFIDMKDEIYRHKWIESEKRGIDVGFENALVDWINKHRTEWAKHKFNNVINEK
jgi:hypothetical protein